MLDNPKEFIQFLRDLEQDKVDGGFKYSTISFSISENSSLFVTGNIFLTEGSVIGYMKESSITLEKIQRFLIDNNNIPIYEWRNHIEIYIQGTEIILCRINPNLIGFLCRRPYNLKDPEVIKNMMENIYNECK